VVFRGLSVAGPASYKAGVLAVRVEVRCDFAVGVAEALRAIQTYTPAGGTPPARPCYGRNGNASTFNEAWAVVSRGSPGLPSRRGWWAPRGGGPLGRGVSAGRVGTKHISPWLFSRIFFPLCFFFFELFRN